jgi:hypothetical protein
MERDNCRFSLRLRLLLSVRLLCHLSPATNSPLKSTLHRYSRNVVSSLAGACDGLPQPGLCSLPIKGLATVVGESFLVFTVDLRAHSVK